MASIHILGVPHEFELSDPRPNQPVLVFVHGWLLSRQYWQPLIERLSPDYQCLTYDLAGFGGSQPLDGRDRDRDFSPQAYANDLIHLLNALDISQAWLIGHSLGGTIALWAASEAPDRVQGVTCINAGGGIYLAEEFERFRSAGQKILQWRPQWLRHVPGLAWLFTRANVVNPLALAWGQQRVIDFVTADFNAARGTLLDSTTEAEVHRLPQLVAALTQPVQFLAGQQDTIMPTKYVHHLASFHPSFEQCGNNTIEVEQCGHLAMLEQPDQVAEHLRTLLN